MDLLDLICILCLCVVIAVLAGVAIGGFFGAMVMVFQYLVWGV